ncbi:MAG: hypothetical protein Q9227_006827 [Pyrenula ochraceoflavens]
MFVHGYVNMFPDDQQTDPLLLGEKEAERVTATARCRLKDRWRCPPIAWALHAIFFLIYLSFLLWTLALRNQARDEGYHCEYQDHMPMWSPALKAVRGTGHYHRFDGSFETPNTYKGTPSSSIDAAWDNITYATGPLQTDFLKWHTAILISVGGVFSISEETLHAVNASEKYSVKLSEEIGGGYMASVEVLHQLHCLNMLRQASYNEYYNDTAHRADPWRDSPEVLRHHLGGFTSPFMTTDLADPMKDHCIDNLRQKASSSRYRVLNRMDMLTSCS